MGDAETSRTEIAPSATDDQVDLTDRRRWRARLIGYQLPAVTLYGLAAAELGATAWSAAYGAAAVAAACGQVLFIRANDAERHRSAQLAAALARAETRGEQRASIGELFVHLARRNQSLLDRQIGLLVQMEEQQADPDELDRLFRLDHLATRIRRNAESLLVLSGADPPRRWGRPVALADVVRAAVSEVEDYRRTDVAIDDGVGMVGRAVADIAHLLAELIENGLQFSPPETRVRVANLRRPDGGCELRIEDRGIGMATADRDAANALLASPPEIDLRSAKRLGFHVVSRLAVRYGLRVRLVETPGGGLTAVVLVPEGLLAEPDSGGPAAGPRSDALPVAPHPEALPVAPRTAAAVVAAVAPSEVAPVAPERTATGSARRAEPISAAVLPQRRPSPPPPPPPALPARPAPEPVTRLAPAAGAPAPDGGLPRRVPLRSLHPDLGAAAPASPSPAPPTRSREDVRAMLSRFQANQARARQDVAEPADPAHRSEVGG